MNQASCVRFLHQKELEHVLTKIDDIRALDEIARFAPPGWSFRPVTCNGTSVCLLKEAGVLKRTHSCGSEHIIMRPTVVDVAKHLKCEANQRRTSKRRVAQTMERWFHQEFVKGLRQFGEFRVFIVTAKDITATRGRKGKVIEVVHTLELADRELVVTVLSSCASFPGPTETHQGIHIQQVKHFAFYAFETLRSRSDWFTVFESLEVGARIDVGVTMSGDVAQPFINEVTRIYEADFFAEWLAQPGTYVSSAVSTALAEVFIAATDS
ncbi:hypothetical protein WHR41_09193 [Cladosporium halotolerans]|uniref:Uncharacterized protein n=1 Tax=Cladosporium halotolerans TaxID=1052096 RepID=A0AB34KG29_9PEZI